jgi:hypothetical protein
MHNYSRRTKRSIVEEILARKIVTEIGCWEDPLYKENNSGYAFVRVGQFKYQIANLVYEHLLNTFIPTNMEPDHTCLNPKCFNPAHVDIVTHKENCIRRNARRKFCNKGHELTDDNIIEYKSDGHKRCKKCRELSSKKGLKTNVKGASEKLVIQLP